MLLAFGLRQHGEVYFYGKTLHSLKWQPETDECVSATDSVKMRVRILTSCKNRVKTTYKQEEGAIILNPKRSLGRYAQTNFLFGRCLPVFRLQWSPIAPSKRKHICSKIEVVIIITLTTDLGVSLRQTMSSLVFDAKVATPCCPKRRRLSEAYK